MPAETAACRQRSPFLSELVPTASIAAALMHANRAMMNPVAVLLVCSESRMNVGAQNVYP
jgi:hypothetical protein